MNIYIYTYIDFTAYALTSAMIEFKQNTLRFIVD